MLAAGGGRAESTVSRDYDVHWTIKFTAPSERAREARVWIAIPQQLPEQKVSNLTVKTTNRWRFVEDPTFHNRVMEVTIPRPKGEQQIELGAHVHREAVTKPRPAKLKSAERRLYLRDEALVSLSPRLGAIADSVGGTSRSRYDYVLARMDYDKTVPGWGRGDSERACDVGKGNCTDFHSLFMSLSRLEGVPTRFEMGYSMLAEGEKNHEGGYHCWAWFYDDAGKAWIPVDISEADKHPEKAEYFFGNLDAERITFSVGRDIRLPGMKGTPLNYLPSGAYVEVDGKPLDQGVTRSITYTVAPASSAAGN
jgi:transglutaminase-like putative cysteine protease